jgi:hypothetical protein
VCTWQQKHAAAELQPDPLGAVNEAERDEGLSLLVGELVRPRHPAGEVGAGARALVLPVEHRAAWQKQQRPEFSLFSQFKSQQEWLLINANTI